MGDISIGQHDSRMKIATRNIILMMIGKMTSLLGAGIYTFAMGLYVLKTTGSGMGFAITLVCGSLPRMICGPIAGAVADRVNRKWLVIGTDLLSSLTMLSMFILATIFGSSLLFHTSWMNSSGKVALSESRDPVSARMPCLMYYRTHDV